MAPKGSTDLAARPDRAILVAVDRGVRDIGIGWPVEESLAELARLADTAGAEVVGTITQRMVSPVAATYVGSGKVQEIKDLVEDTEATFVIFDDELSPRQQANLEKQFGDNVRVADRTGLILDIFAQHARTREGKLQVELATYQYELPRLRGMWVHLEKEKLGGGLGARFGSGESQLETDRRLARKRISVLRRELEGIERERQTQRRERIERGTTRVALVGYTNAGKSTLLNALTGAGVLAYDKLFATLDSTTRRLSLPSGRQATITDTVGFINKLPHDLVAAFKSTLAEVIDADILLHVVDVASPMRSESIATVNRVLHDLGAADVPTILVWNKIDAMEDAADVEALLAKHPSSVAVSAANDQNLDGLLDATERVANQQAKLMRLLVPYTRGDLLELLRREGSIVSLEHLAEGTAVTAHVPQRFADSFSEYEVAVGE